jgi:glycine cleavage system regulatory protein
MMALSTVRAALARPLLLSKTFPVSASRYVSSNTTTTTTARNTSLVINAIGLDRPGIVSDVTKQVTDKGGNVGDAQASKLGRYFGIMMQIQISASEKEGLEQALGNMKDVQASILQVQPADADLKATTQPKIAYSGKFELKGASYPGIVHRVTSVLSKHGLSIETMGTTEEIAPYGGTCLFKMHGIAHAFEPLPKTFDSSQIREELRDLGNDLNCDLTLEDVEEESFSKTFYGTS